MRRAICAIALSLFALNMVPPANAQTDDWDLLTDPQGRWAAAEVLFSSGNGIRVECAGGYVQTHLLGLDRMRDYQIIERLLPEGGVETAVWRIQDDRTRRVSPDGARYARLIARQPSLNLRLVERDGRKRALNLELPSQHANLDAILTACGEALLEPDDSQQTAWELITKPPALEMPSSALADHDRIAITVVCTIAGDQLTACRSPSQNPTNERAGAALAARANAHRLGLVGPADGQTLEIIVTGQRFRR